MIAQRLLSRKLDSFAGKKRIRDPQTGDAERRPGRPERFTRTRLVKRQTRCNSTHEAAVQPYRTFASLHLTSKGFSGLPVAGHRTGRSSLDQGKAPQKKGKAASRTDSTNVELRRSDRQQRSPARGQVVAKASPPRVDAGHSPRRVAILVQRLHLHWQALHFCCPAGKLEVNV